MKTDIGIRTTLNLPYEQALQKTADALKAEGFGVQSQVDMQVTREHGLEMDCRRHMILSTCNHPLANRLLSSNLDAGLLLPCNVTVYEEGTGSIVTAVDPLEIFSVIQADPATYEVAVEARVRLQRVIANLKQSE